MIANHAPMMMVSFGIHVHCFTYNFKLRLAVMNCYCNNGNITQTIVQGKREEGRDYKRETLI